MLEKPYEIDRTADFNCRRGGDARPFCFCAWRTLAADLSGRLA